VELRPTAFNNRTIRTRVSFRWLSSVSSVHHTTAAVVFGMLLIVFILGDDANLLSITVQVIGGIHLHVGDADRHPAVTRF
jgi:hypothetical protein